MTTACRFRARCSECLDTAICASSASVGGSFVATEIVHDDDVTSMQGRDQNLFDMGLECLAVDRPVDHPRGCDPVMAQGGHKGHSIPMSKWSPADQAFAPRSPAPQRGHVGLGPSLINKYKVLEVNPALLRLPAPALAHHVRPVLFTGQRGFF